ncbi:MAG: NAD(P)/FAD-dependent oxidoreductase [Rhodothermales bacterium]|nr:NAD(P)/FAD-dependent oxidoreductase [Rhodothermales bacterium]MBO6779768.1 NAD(P)/FAD-dependent oxidoreductase [Rhodothermales bacterium]
MHIVIVGNGITGVTAARMVRKRSDHAITIVSGESDYHYARTALMYIYMGDLRYEDTKPYPDDFWSRNRIQLVRDHATRVDAEAQELHLASGERIRYDRLLLATGSKPNRFGWPGEHAAGVQGLYSLDDLTRMAASTVDVEHAAVVGGGLIGVEMAEMLASRGIHTTFLVREQRYMDYIFCPQESEVVEQAIRAHDVDLELGAELESIHTGDGHRAESVRMKDGRTLPAGFVGLAVGVSPRTDLAEASGLETGRGIFVDRSFQTSAPHVFAAGDCAEFRDPLPGRKAVEQLWYTGRSHGRQVAAGLLGEPAAYRPPLFFNSAKFFDLEYQTYGVIGPDEPEQHIISDGHRLVRIASSRGVVKGVNGLGVRLRQNVWSHWLRTRARLDEVLADFDRCLFDPEFSQALKVTA